MILCEGSVAQSSPHTARKRLYCNFAPHFLQTFGPINLPRYLLHEGHLQFMMEAASPPSVAMHIAYTIYVRVSALLKYSRLLAYQNAKKATANTKIVII